MLPEFWEKTFEEDPTINKEEAEEIITMFREYSIFAVAAAELSDMGIPNYKSEDFLQETTLLIDTRNRRHYAHKKDRIDGDTQLMLNFFETYFSQLLGELGENITTCVFGSNIIDPLEKNDFKIIVDQKSFTFKLPLGSLLPLKFCPEDGEKFNGGWLYCPFHGTYLKKCR